MQVTQYRKIHIYCFLTQSGHPVSKWALFNFAVFHSKFVALLLSAIYVLSEVLVVHHGSFQMQRIFSIFLKTTIIKSAHFESGSTMCIICVRRETVMIVIIIVAICLLACKFKTRLMVYQSLGHQGRCWYI